MDDDVRLRQRRLHGALDRVGRRVALADGSAVFDADHDVREHPPRRLSHAQSTQLHRRVKRVDRLARSFLRSGGSPVHQDVDVAPHQPGGGEEDEHGDEECGGGIRPGVAGTHEQQTDEHGDRAGEVAAEMKRVRSKCGARVGT